MPVQTIPAAESQINTKPEVVRRTANYEPSIWGDRFANYAEDIVCIGFITTTYICTHVLLII